MNKVKQNLKLIYRWETKSETDYESNFRTQKLLPSWNKTINQEWHKLV